MGGRGLSSRRRSGCDGRRGGNGAFCENKDRTVVAQIRPLIFNLIS